MKTLILKTTQSRCLLPTVCELLAQNAYPGIFFGKANQYHTQGPFTQLQQMLQKNYLQKIRNFVESIRQNFNLY